MANYAIQQLLDASGYRAVFYDPTTGTHTLRDPAYLALAHVVGDPEATNDLVPLTYVLGSGGSGLVPMADDPNFCGLMPRKTSLSAFVAATCHHSPLEGDVYGKP